MPDDSQASVAKGRKGKGSAEGAGKPELPEVDRSSLKSLQSLLAVPLDPQTLVHVLRPILAPLHGMLEREMADRRTLQGQADDLRAQLATAQLATAEATRNANVEHAMRVSAEARIKDLQGQIEMLRDALVEPPPRPSWWPF
jgi:hypothetical protein